MKKEILHIFRDNIAFLIAFVAPFALLALVGFLYIGGKVTNLPIVVFDQDQSEVSRTIVRSFGDSERLNIIKNVTSYAEMEKMLQSEQADMAVVIPNNLEKDIKMGRATEVALILNSTNILTMNVVGTAASTVVQTISSGVTMKVMEGSGMSKEKAYQAVTAISFRTRNWYNPTISYLVFMLLGLVGTVIQQVTFLGVALSFAREKEAGTWQLLISSKLKWIDVFIGKLLVFFVIYSIDALASYGIGIYYFGLPMRGDALLFVLLIELFILVLVAMGMAISFFAQSSSQAIEISMLIAVPSFLISGYTWPYISMPGPIQVLSRLLPLSHFLEAAKRIVYMGAGWDVVAPQFMILGLFLVICLPLTAIALNWKMKRS